MTYRLLLSVRPERLSRLGTSELLWQLPPNPSSFRASIGPDGERLGQASLAAADLLRLATTMYIVDRTTPRPTGDGNRWSRELELDIPVTNVDAWMELADPLADLAGFLTGDHWAFRFRALRLRRRRAARPEPAAVVSLFSGGADSFCGALLAHRELGRPPMLISHSDWPITTSVQTHALEAAQAIAGVNFPRIQVDIGRRSTQVGSGTAFKEESTSRSRALLFIALGIVAAEARGAELWVPENGFMAINPPLAPERRATLSTRSTHPRFLDGIRVLLQTVGIHTNIRNPFEETTKGEVFSRLVDQVGEAPAANALARTRSCARAGANWEGFPPQIHCGVCVACLVRRSAFIAAKLSDKTEYIERVLVPGNPRRTAWLTPTRRMDFEAVQYAVARGFSRADVLRLRLPSRIDSAAALKLIQDGLSELAAVRIP